MNKEQTQSLRWKYPLSAIHAVHNNRDSTLTHLDLKYGDDGEEAVGVHGGEAAAAVHGDGEEGEVHEAAVAGTRGGEVAAGTHEEAAAGTRGGAVAAAVHEAAAAGTHDGEAAAGNGGEEAAGTHGEAAAAAGNAEEAAAGSAAAVHGEAVAGTGVEGEGDRSVKGVRTQFQITKVSDKLHTLSLTETPRASRGAATYAVEAPMRARTTKLRRALNCIKPVS